MLAANLKKKRNKEIQYFKIGHPQNNLKTRDLS